MLKLFSWIDSLRHKSAASPSAPTPSSEATESTPLLNISTNTPKKEVTTHSMGLCENFKQALTSPANSQSAHI